MDIETVIKLNKFCPRPYQEDVLYAVEKQGYKKVLLNWHRRCLSGDTHIIMADGSFKFLKDIKVGDKIISWDGENFVRDTVKNIWKTDIKQTKIVQSPGFLPIISSIDHVFACKDKSYHKIHWIPLKDISRKRALLSYAGTSLGKINNPDLAEFLGYMICDGYISGYQQPKFTNINLDTLKRVEYLAMKLFDMKVIWRSKGNCYDLGMSNGTKGGGETKNKVKELFRDEDLDVPKSIRSIPKILWNLDAESLGRFFSAMISSDGGIYIHKAKEFELSKGMIAPVEITFNCGKSYQHAWGIYWLLRKMGIKPQNPYNEKKSNWKIRISACDSVKYLLSFGIIYGKTDKQQEALKHLEQTHKKRIITNGCFSSIFTTQDGQPEELYDIETEKFHNFVANGYVVHNSGKDVVAFNIMIREALRKVGVFFYCLPTYNQGRKVIWDGILSNGMRFLDFIPIELIANKNNAEMKLTLINGSIIQVVGSDNAAQTLVGTNPQGVVFSEWAIANPDAYTFIRPALVYNNAWAIFVSTPRGRNFFYEMDQIARHNPKDWFLSTKTIDDTGVISLEEIAKERAEGLISDDMIEQEYKCSFSAGVEGAYYTKYIDKMRIDGRITNVPWEPSFKVHTAWDLGVHDKTCIIMFQTIGQIVRIIDYYENCDKGLDYYAKILQEKNYLWGMHFAPHDIAVRELSTGLSRIELARRMGINFKVLPNIPKEDGIELARITFSKLWIDESKCSKLIKALENYRREWDSKKKVYHDHDLHNEDSHPSDAYRYLCMALPKTKDQCSAEELDRRYAEAMYGTSNNVPRPFQEKYY